LRYPSSAHDTIDTAPIEWYIKRGMAGAAVIPVLASADLDLQLRRKAARKRTKSSCSVLDDVLMGGVDSGRITCISGDRGLGKTTVRKYGAFICEV
jgi:predicted ATP-dependent serine protease